MTLTAPAPTAIEDVYELSPVQEGMLFYSAAGPESGTYVVQLRCRLSGPLHDAAFERAWQDVLRRHPILRTSFHWREAEKPLQVVHRSVPLSLHREDWRELTPQAQEDALNAYLARDRRLGFPLEEAPLLRLALFRLADETHELVWSLHHLLLDGWSLALVLQDLLTHYEAARQAGPRAPAPLPRPRPFGDYVEWLQGQDLRQAEAYWRGALAGITAATPLPLSDSSVSRDPAPESAPPSLAPGERQVELSAEATAALGDLTRRHQVTLSTVVQGAWALLLGRHSGQPDVLFGLTVSGRPADLQGVESMVGMFINTLPVRVRVAPDEPLIPWLRRLQEQQAELRQFEYTPLVRLHGWTDLPPRAPLFESIVVFENYPVGGALQEGSSLTVGTSGAVEQTNYPLSLVAGPGERLALKLLYDPARYAPATAERLLGHLTTLLEGIASTSDARLGDLPLLPPAERRQVLRDWNATASPYPRDATVHQLVAARAARDPQAVAVVDGGATLTYGELEARANRLAQHLLALDVDPEDRVGVCLGRSVAAVVALLAVLKAGAVYVPLDPAYPPARLAGMLEDAGARVVLTTSEAAAGLLSEEARPVHLVRLDDPREALAIAARPATPPQVPVAPEGLAYVVYTSGSTGRPKGVAVTHRAINRLVCNTDYITLTPADRMALASNLSFDAATFELWGALIHGARLVVVDPATALSPPDLVALIRREQIGVMFLTTALFNQLAATTPDAFRTMRHVSFGGEAADPRAAATVLRAAPPEALLNVYGPTECTTFATWHLLDEPPAETDNLPIGRPIANTEAYVLDARRQPVPAGVPGELYLGGDGLARGYLGRPGLTAGRFVPHPFGAPGARLYRTGDRARWLPSGALEFLGRLDRQVKIRGHRIEPGEVEATVARHPRVGAAAVLVQDGPGGDKRLVAYLSPRQDDSPPPGAAPEDSTEVRIRDRTEDEPLAAAVRAALRARMPEYMLPGAIVVLDALPLNPNGKIDRAALPALEAAARRDTTGEDPHHPGGQRLAPRDGVELELVQMWERLLGVSPIGVRDDFFELGGHSLLALRLVAEVERRFEQRIPLATLFPAVTVETVARALRQAPGAGPRSPLLILQPAGDGTPLFFVHPIGGAATCYLALSRYLSPQRPFYALEDPALYGDETLESTLPSLAARYLAAVREARPQGPYALGGWSYGGIVAFEMARQLEAQGETVEAVLLVDSATPDTVGEALSAVPDKDLPAFLVTQLPGSPWTSLSQLNAELADLSPEGRLRAVYERIKGFDALPPDADEDWLRRYVRLWTARMGGLREYAPAPRAYGGRVVLYRAQTPEPGAPAPGAPGPESSEPVSGGWERLCREAVEVHTAPGTHHTLVQEPHAAPLAALIETALIPHP